MSLKFKEIKRFLGRRENLSICFSDGLHYDNYLMISDVPEGKYDDLEVYGIGKIDVEFSFDEFAKPEDPTANGALILTGKDDDLQPALEVMVQEHPRENIVRERTDGLFFGDLRKYLQIWGGYGMIMREDPDLQFYKEIKDIPTEYDAFYVYGIGLADSLEKKMPDLEHSSMNKMFVIVLSKELRSDLRK